MIYILGIDGGGTKTRAMMADEAGNLLAETEGGPTNINAAGYDSVKSVLSEVLSGILMKTGAVPSNCVSLCIGAAGAGRQDERDKIAHILNANGFTCNVTVTDDVTTALYGGLEGEPGVMLISGTGSICLGRNRQGEMYRCGGWGHILGDEGSGYDIGRGVLTAVMRAFDGRGPETAMTSMVLDYLKMKSAEDMVEYVYRSGVGKKDIAALARFADIGCEVKDSAALSLLDNAAQELNLAVSTVIRRLQFDSAPDVCLGGGVLNRSHFLRERLTSLLTHSYPEISVIPMKRDAAWGAVYLARENIQTVHHTGGTPCRD